MTKFSIREFKLASAGAGDGLHAWLDARGAFVGDGVAPLTRDVFGDFAPLPRRELETILSAGCKSAVDLGSRMHGLAAFAKALNQGDHALAAIVLAQMQFPALPDKGAAARMTKAAAMLGDDASAAEVLRHFFSTASWRSSTPIILAPALEAENSPRRRWTGRVPGMRNRKAMPRNEILDQAEDNPKTPGWLQPKDVKPGNEKECVSLVRAVIPELPHSSQWQEGDPVTPESVKDLASGTAIATFEAAVTTTRRQATMRRSSSVRI